MIIQGHQTLCWDSLNHSVCPVFHLRKPKIGLVRPNSKWVVSRPLFPCKFWSGDRVTGRQRRKWSHTCTQQTPTYKHHTAHDTQNTTQYIDTSRNTQHQHRTHSIRNHCSLFPVRGFSFAYLNADYDDGQRTLKNIIPSSVQRKLFSTSIRIHWAGSETAQDPTNRWLRRLSNVFVRVIPGAKECLNQLSELPRRCLPVLSTERGRTWGRKAIFTSIQPVFTGVQHSKPHIRTADSVCSDNQCRIEANGEPTSFSSDVICIWPFFRTLCIFGVRFSKGSPVLVVVKKKIGSHQFRPSFGEIVRWTRSPTKKTRCQTVGRDSWAKGSQIRPRWGNYIFEYKDDISFGTEWVAAGPSTIVTV